LVELLVRRISSSLSLRRTELLLFLLQHVNEITPPQFTPFDRLVLNGGLAAKHPPLQKETRRWDITILDHILAFRSSFFCREQLTRVPSVIVSGSMNLFTYYAYE
jgi:hypothetical protein